MRKGKRQHLRGICLGFIQFGPFEIFSCPSLFWFRQWLPRCPLPEPNIARRDPGFENPHAAQGLLPNSSLRVEAYPAPVPKRPATSYSKFGGSPSFPTPLLPGCLVFLFDHLLVLSRLGPVVPCTSLPVASQTLLLLCRPTKMTGVLFHP